MDIVVLVKQVPDLVEELEVDEAGNAIDRDLTRFVVSEFDSHALEEGMLLKERHGGTVTALSLDIGEAEEALFAALAQGVDRAINLTGEFPQGMDNHQAARAFAGALKDVRYDLILTGAQAIDDVDGQVGGLLAGYLGLPYVSVVSQVRIDEEAKVAVVSKELAGGMEMRLEMDLPGVIGIQAAEQPPRYVPVGRIRQARHTAALETRDAAIGPGGVVKVRRVYKPEPTRRAEILSGDDEEVAEAIVKLLGEKGFLR